MLRYYEGTVFNTNADVLVNTVNCFGVMGAGIALEFKLRYPDMFIRYEEMCKNKLYKVGHPRLFRSSNKSILNFPTKNHWRAPSKIEWIEDGLKYFAMNYKKAEIKSIAFPKLGTSNGGLKWEEVKPLMERYLGDLDGIDITICLDELKEAEGVEKSMVDEFNSTQFDLLKKEFKLNKKQDEIIKQSMPIKRFWIISTLPSIGEKTYEKIFKYFYGKYNNELNNNMTKIEEQISLF